jgi:hypothetical protein
MPTTVTTLQQAAIEYLMQVFARQGDPYPPVQVVSAAVSILQPVLAGTSVNEFRTAVNLPSPRRVAEHGPEPD